MNEYYFTFGSQYRRNEHPNYPKAHPDGWVTIEAEDYGKAREKSEEIFGLIDGLLAFSFQYDKSDFQPQYFPLGEIERFKA